MGGYDTSLTEESVAEAWDACIGAGVVLFDTAEVYGGGESERIIGRMIARDRSVRHRVVIASKFMPSPWKVNVKSALVSAARRSGERLGIETIDLYQIHGPISLRSHDALAEALAAAHAEGLVKAVGVSNYSVKETRSMDAALRRNGLRLATQPGRVLPPSRHARSCRSPLRLRRARRGRSGLLADRTGPPHREVLRRQPAAGPAYVLGPSHGPGGRSRRRSCVGSGRRTTAAAPARWPWPG